jgi:hypothetical protein
MHKAYLMSMLPIILIKLQFLDHEIVCCFCKLRSVTLRVYNKLYMIVMLINLSYLSLSCYNAIKNRNILFHHF